MTATDPELGEVWKALSDPTRRRILDALREGPKTTGTLCAMFPQLSRFAVIKHLGALEEAHLLIVTPKGRERWNSLNVVPIQQIHDRWIRPYEALWATKLLRLKQIAEQPAAPAVTEKGPTAMPETTASPAALKGLGHMAIDQEIAIAASPATVYEALTKDVTAWWGADHSASDQMTDIVLECELGGRFYEVGANGETHLWSRVTALKPDAYLEFTGPMGASGVVHGVYSFTLEAQGAKTLLKLSHHAIGEVDEKLQAGYTRGWKELMGQLQLFVETGKRSGIR
jgi:uncharacterized protein YndB with AHSA1/START domain/DNA-binding transcriptional ArsR family regulator